ncbi:hypothetical protein [Streptomyces flavidovirens]
MVPSLSPAPIPVPDRVADLIASQFPPQIKVAVRESVKAATAFGWCRTEFTREAREYAISDMARQNKILAAYNPGLIVTGGGSR